MQMPGAMQVCGSSSHLRPSTCAGSLLLIQGCLTVGRHLEEDFFQSGDRQATAEQAQLLLVLLQFPQQCCKAASKHMAHLSLSFSFLFWKKQTVGDTTSCIALKLSSEQRQEVILPHQGSQKS